jgi:Tol biopolymer transport system component
MSLEPGTRLGPYEIVELRGKGGMGEVYRAHDSRLGRDVAIKVLPARLSEDPAFKSRFEREAKTISQLQHPNVCSLFDVGSEAGVDYLVMELLEGTTLEERLGGSRLSPEEALRIGREVAEAIEAAHRRGIVHRDLKPGNVMLTPTGAKVLDFGLARGYSSSPDQIDPEAATVPAPITEEGRIVGTVPYMSPEQLTGAAVDSRTDIWALGCVLHEMLSGERPFHGDSRASLIASILGSQPEAATREGPPAATSGYRVVRRCLEKDPERRWQSARDVALELEALEEDDEMHGPPSVQAYRGRAWLAAATGVIAGIGVSALLAGLWWPRAQSSPLRVVDVVLEGARVSSDRAPVLSPDGSRIAFVRERQLWIRDLDELAPRRVEGTEGASTPFWSPDSELVGYGADERLWKVPAAGGRPVVVTELTSSGLDGAAWGPDGRIVVAVNPGLREVSAGGGEAKMFVEADRETENDFHDPSFLPNGDIVFRVHGHGGRSAIGLWDGAQRRDLIELSGARSGSNPIYSPTGHLLYSKSESGSTGVWAVPFSVDASATTGEPFLVAPDAAYASLSAGGSLLYVPVVDDSQVQLQWIERDGSPGELLGEAASLVAPAIAPDGREVAVSVSDGESLDIWRMDERGNRARITSSSVNDIHAAWFPDGRRLVFSRIDDETIVEISEDGRGQGDVLTEGRKPSISADGALLFFSKRVLVEEAQGRALQRDLWYLDLSRPAGQREPVHFLRSPFEEDGAVLSPDGRLVAYESEESGRAEIHVTRFPEASGKAVVSLEGGEIPRWAPDAKRLYFLDRAGNLLEVVVESAEELRFSTPKEVLRSSAGEGATRVVAYDVAPDGGRFLIARPQNQAAKSQRLVLVQSWFEELERLVPGGL